LPEDKRQLLAEIDRCKAYLELFFNRLNHLDRDSVRRPLGETLQAFATGIHRYPRLHFTYETFQDQSINPMVGELIGLLLEILAENAEEAQATTFHVKACFSKRFLTLDVYNDGPPFPDEIQALMALGYSQDKGVYHTGIGLFLAKLVIENLGAKAHVVNTGMAHLSVLFPMDTVDTL
jgi:signal transduction histidine kinase